MGMGRVDRASLSLYIIIHNNTSFESFLNFFSLSESTVVLLYRDCYALFWPYGKTEISVLTIIFATHSEMN